ncbi:MAG: hypothetical protein ACYCZJ_16245 [Sulfuriferula sp.]
MSAFTNSALAGTPMISSVGPDGSPTFRTLLDLIADAGFKFFRVEALHQPPDLGQLNILVR